MDKGAELTVVDADIDVQKSTWEGEVFQVKWKEILFRVAHEQVA